VQVSLDTSHYRPCELCVKVEDGNLCIEGNHIEKSKDGRIMKSRSFVKMYAMPTCAAAEKVSCNVSKDGVLVVTVPRVTAAAAIEDSVDSTEPREAAVTIEDPADSTSSADSTVPRVTAGAAAIDSSADSTEKRTD
jgi:hypothetical protein